MKIYFTDFWSGFNCENSFLFQRIKSIVPDVQLDSQAPEFVFCSAFGNNHFKYKNSIKIYFTGENDVPNFNLYDYGISFHDLNFGERHLRFPLYIMYNGFKSLSYPKQISRNLAKRKFCNFVYSNYKAVDPFRDYFFKELSKYKKVDSGGKHLNNIGGCGVPNKLEFIKDYKFTIAFENSSVPGYTTEKIMEPMVVNSIPIYWGNPYIGNDFNSESFILVNNITEIDKIINEIIYLDKNDDAYNELLNKPWLSTNNLTYEQWCERLDDFLLKVFQQKEFKRTKYGYTSIITQKAEDLTKYSSIERFLEKFNNR